MFTCPANLFTNILFLEIIKSGGISMWSYLPTAGVYVEHLTALQACFLTILIFIFVGGKN